MFLLFVYGTMNTIISHAGRSGTQVFTAELQQIAGEMAAFPLGKFLLENRGLNGKWTSYLISTTTSSNSLELRFLHAPTAAATRERFGIFQKQLLKYMRPGATVASIPCGVMDDLLTLPHVPEGVSFFGSDLDPESLAAVAARLGEGQRVELFRQNAWNLGITGKFDVIASNGLNIYEPNDERVTDLYRNFFKALKPGGTLVTSFLTPKESWHDCNAEELAWQRMIYADVLQVNWQHFRTEETTRAQLSEAGFEVVEVIPDKQGIFPTVVARASRRK